MPTERPILFSGAMVRAILAGQKTVTRRVVKPPFDSLLAGGAKVADLARVPFAVGHQLWVRETWRTDTRGSEGYSGISYRADGAFEVIENTREAADHWVEAHDNGKHGTDWRPSIFMRPWMCRLKLEVTDVRAERLQEMDGFAAIAEGIPAKERCGCEVCVRSAGMCPADHGVHVEEFAALWDSINGKRLGCSWRDNPFVWVVAFKRVECFT